MAQMSQSYDVRVAEALGAVAAAYLTSLYQSQWGAASGLLASFQTLYNENRRALVASFGVQSGEAENVLPSNLPIDGQFRPRTRDALVGALLASGRDDAVDSMPSQTAAEVAQWLNATLGMVQGGDTPLINRLVGEDFNAGAAASEWAFRWINQIQEGGAQSVVNEIITATNPPPPQPSTTPRTIEQGQTFFLTAERTQPTSDLWTYFLWGGLLLAGGSTIYFVKRGKWPWQRGGRRRRRRRRR